MIVKYLTKKSQKKAQLNSLFLNVKKYIKQSQYVCARADF